MQVIKTNQEPTMSHRQITDFLNSTGEPYISATGELVFTERSEDETKPKVRLDNVKRTIERLAEAGAIEFTPTEGVRQNLTGPTPIEYMLNERDSYVVIAQLSPVFTAQLVDVWRKLKDAVRPAITVHSSRAILFAELARQAEELERAEAEAEQLKLTVEQQSELIDEAAQEIAEQEEELRKIEIELQWLVRFEQFKEAISSTDLATIFKEKLFKIDGVRSHEFKPSVQEINIILMKMGLIGHRMFRGEKKPNPTVIYQAFYERFPQVPVKQQHNGVPEAMKFNRTSDYFTKFLLAVKKYGVKHKIGVKQVPGNGAFTF